MPASDRRRVAPLWARGVVARLKWGIKWGAVAGIGLSLLAIAAAVFGGSEPFRRAGTNFTAVLLVYLAASIAAGSIVGVFVTVARTRIGAPVVGFIALLPLSVFIRLATKGFEPWTTEDTFVVLFYAAVLGAASGVTYREIFKKEISGGSSTREE